METLHGQLMLLKEYADMYVCMYKYAGKEVIWEEVSKLESN